MGKFPVGMVTAVPLTFQNLILAASLLEFRIDFLTKLWLNIVL